jgi:2-polyprenyl-6-methoxyphenol hydroxylase-like FAD-dependent oxidoreductase
MGVDVGARTALVVGGGIGGLASAIALRRAGWQVQVLERSEEPREVGAGISLWPNALHALDLLGVGDRCCATTSTGCPHSARS